MQYYKIGRLSFSSLELNNLLKAWVAISLAFAIVLSGRDIFSSNFSTFFLISAFTVGLGFLLHELGHKYLAQRYRCFAEFRSFDFMLIFAVLISFLGFVFVAPGAVMIQGAFLNKDRYGKISLMGPAVNIVLAVLFLIVGVLFPVARFVTNYGVMINSWIAIFNLLPFWNFDGVKILRWNKMVYVIALVLAVGLLVSFYSF